MTFTTNVFCVNVIFKQWEQCQFATINKVAILVEAPQCFSLQVTLQSIKKLQITVNLKFYKAPHQKTFGISKIIIFWSNLKTIETVTSNRGKP